MLKIFNLRSFRLLTLGAAKASTMGDVGIEDEDLERQYNP